ncbi:MAG TPA: hypothetical protein VIT91_08095 [Chthoniobacterales bacterium]
MKPIISIEQLDHGFVVHGEFLDGNRSVAAAAITVADVKARAHDVINFIFAPQPQPQPAPAPEPVPVPQPEPAQEPAEVAAPEPAPEPEPEAETK